MPWVPIRTNSTQISSGIHTYDPLLKILGKWSVPCATLVRIWLLLSPNVTRTGSGWKWSTAAIYEPELYSLHFPESIEFKSILVDELFSTLKSLSHRRNIASLSLFPWEVFRQTTFLSSAIHRDKLLSFPLYSISEKCKFFSSSSFS